MEKGETMTEGYCVRCKAKKLMVNPRPIVFKNGRHAIQGTCPICGTKMTRIVSKLHP